MFEDAVDRDLYYYYKDLDAAGIYSRNHCNCNCGCDEELNTRVERENGVCDMCYTEHCPECGNDLVTDSKCNNCGTL